MLLLKNARYLDAPVDLLVNGKKIVTMTPANHCQMPDGCQVFDAAGLNLLPALIDASPRLTDADRRPNIASLMAEALYGGFGSLMYLLPWEHKVGREAMPTCLQKIAGWNHSHGLTIYPVAPMVDAEDCQMEILARMKASGCLAISTLDQPPIKMDIMRKIMENLAKLGMVFIACGRTGVERTANLIALAEKLKLPLHIANVSSQDVVEQIAEAKARGAKISAGTCPHYLFLEDDEAGGYNAVTRMKHSPASADCAALRQALKAGIIDILATDSALHVRHGNEQAGNNPTSAPVNSCLPLELSFQLVKKEIIDEDRLHRLWCQRPAEIFDLPWNGFAPGDPADFFLYDPAEKWKMNREKIGSPNQNSPDELPFSGPVRHIWLAGQQLF